VGVVLTELTALVQRFADLTGPGGVGTLLGEVPAKVLASSSGGQWSWIGHER
jgi:hypothetical protein